MAGAGGSRTPRRHRRAPTNGFEVLPSVSNKPHELVNSFLTEKVYQGLSPETIRFYRGYLTRYINKSDFPALAATQLQITRFISSQECTAGGRHAYFRAIRAFYIWLASKGYIDKAPTSDMKAPKVPKPIRYAVPLDAIPALMTACNSSQDRLIVSLLADTGLRRKELANITLSDINLDDRIITVWGKGAKQRVVCYGTVSARYMSEYLDETEPKGQQTIIPNVWVITNLLEELGEKTGIKCNAHSFRRTFATESVRNGMNLFHVQSLLGHSSLTMTRIYAEQVNSEDAIKAYKPIVR